MEHFIAAEKQLIFELEQILQGEFEMTTQAKKAARLIQKTLSSFREQIRATNFKRDCSLPTFQTVIKYKYSFLIRS